MVLRRRDVLPFCLGFGAALLLTSLRLANTHLNGASSASDDWGANWQPDHAFAQAAIDGHAGKPPRKKVLAVIGVQTGFTTRRSDPKYDYGLRRAALRSTWFPATQAALDEFEAATGILLRFVIGSSSNPAAEAGLEAEQAKHGGFMRLPLQEGYSSLTNKTLTFLRYVSQRYDAQYIVKMDDDVYLRLDRMPTAIAQWTRLEADYIGCMKTGTIFKSATLRWYEPQHALLGSQSYFAHCWGSVYVLSGRAAAAVEALQPDSLRFFANEDVTVGSWMLAMNMRHYDDRRMCETECSEASLAVYDMPQCAGLCDAAARLPELHALPECRTPATRPDGTLPMRQPIFDFDAAR